MSGWRGLRAVWPAVARVRRHVRPRAVRVEQLRRRRARRHRRRARRRSARSRCSAACGSRATRGTSAEVAGPMPVAVGPPPRSVGSTRAHAERCARVDAVGVPQRRGDRLGAGAGEGVPQRRAAPAAHRAVAPVVNGAGCCTAMVFRDYPGRRPTPVDRARIGDAAYRNDTRRSRACSRSTGLSATGTAILLAALRQRGLPARLADAVFSASPRATLRRMRAPLATIMLMLALGFVTRYGGTDATLGLAFTRTGVLYPFFAHAARLARRGADRLRHQLERALRQPAEDHRAAARLQPGADRHRQQHGRRDGQDDRRAEHRRRDRVDRTVGQEGQILRFVFWHSVALAAIMGVIVMLQAYVFPWMIP